MADLKEKYVRLHNKLTPNKVGFHTVDGDEATLANDANERCDRMNESNTHIHTLATLTLAQHEANKTNMADTFTAPWETDRLSMKTQLKAAVASIFKWNKWTHKNPAKPIDGIWFT